MFLWRSFGAFLCCVCCARATRKDQRIRGLFLLLFHLAYLSVGRGRTLAGAGLTYSPMDKLDKLTFIVYFSYFLFRYIFASKLHIERRYSHAVIFTYLAVYAYSQTWPSANATERNVKKTRYGLHCMNAQNTQSRGRTIIGRTADSKQNDELRYIRLTIILQERYKATNGPCKTTIKTNNKNNCVAVSS